eukprot:11920777-Heterocapsa_arctica.AAC.1
MQLVNTLFQNRHPETHILPLGFIRAIDYIGIASRHVLVKAAGAMDVPRFKTDHNVVYAKGTVKMRDRKSTGKKGRRRKAVDY